MPPGSRGVVARARSGYLNESATPATARRPGVTGHGRRDAQLVLLLRIEAERPELVVHVEADALEVQRLAERWLHLAGA